MLSLRLVVVLAILMSPIACGGSYSSPPASPSPTPSPAPMPGGPSSSVVILLGAEALGNRAYTPPELDAVSGTKVTWMNYRFGDSHFHR